MNGFKVLDLFSGMGGFSYGFAREGFKTTGVDLREDAGVTYKELTGGDFIQSDLHNNTIDDKTYDVIIGGPPCRPWSSVNVTRRGKEHPDYNLVSRFFEHINLHKPRLFLMENVPPLANDEVMKDLITTATKQMGYSLGKIKVTYSDYGASVKRTRLIIAGVHSSDVGGYLWKLSLEHRKATTVEDSISYLKEKDYGSVPDHVWPNLKTIYKYRKYYSDGKYGWRILNWKEPAPSFGNVMKTYTLHPDSSFENNHLRTISVAEASRIMGFPVDFHFKDGIAMGRKYQMIVDSVSPVFSKVLARISHDYLKESYDYVTEPSRYTS